ncbi:MAG: hypothetical protein GX571_10115, partial [Lentisphaerae bacterium]|nr:hypothetical protein [Lentisphaerota bacterium]
GLKLITFSVAGMATNLDLTRVSLDTNAFLVAGGNWTLTNILNSVYLACINVPSSPGQNIWCPPPTSTYAYWSVSNNWSLGHCPLAGEDVLFDFSSPLDCWMNIVPPPLGSIEISESYAGKVVVRSVYPGFGSFSNVTVTGNVDIRGGTMVHVTHSSDYAPDDRAVNRLALNVGGDFYLGPYGAINLDGLGYPKGKGPGAGVSGTTATRRSASHGGPGAYNPVTSTTYGSITQPETLGSGANGPGGGALFLQVDGTATIDGLISAQGIGGSATACPGAGGSIFIKAAAFAGSGTVQAGVATEGYYGSGGGRIALVATSESSFGSMTFRANPSTSTANEGGGRAGTVFLGTPTSGRLIIDQENIGASSANFTLLPSPTETFATAPAISGPLDDAALILTNGAQVALTSDLRMADLPWLGGQLSLNSHTLYLKADAPSGAFPADYGAGTTNLPGVFHTFGNGDTLTRDGRLLWGDAPVTWRVATLVYQDSGGTATNTGYANDQYIAHGSALQLAATAAAPETPFRFWDGTLPGGAASSDANPLAIASLGGNSAFRAWFSTNMVDLSHNQWLPGSVSDDWFAPYNWNLLMVPVAGQNVTLPAGSNVRLSGPSAALGVFTVDPAATLTFDGWNSPLEASTLTIHGTLTHLPQTVTTTNGLGEWDAQHRILLKGQNLTVATDGALNADGKGYLPGAGPGSVPPFLGIGDDGTSYAMGGGGGYGGSGAFYLSGRGGLAYGRADDPWQPGSGGCYRPLYYGSRSKPGGGAIRIEMSGSVTVDGIVSANGPNCTGGGTGGSGGGIAVYCQTFSGATSGWIRATGGTGALEGGSGGGGRIALNYNSTAQAALPVPRPPVRISTVNGNVTNPDTSGATILPVMGTLYL